MWLWNWVWGSESEPFSDESELEGRRRVVVVGGGVGGSFVSYHLQSFAQVTLIDTNEYFEIPWASVRAFVEPSFAERALIDRSEYLPEVETITSYAVNVTESEVMTADGRLIEYDYLVIASGHVGYAATSRTQKLAYYQAEYGKIKSAKSILIIGGGPTGVELAGEIAFDFPEKKLTLVHRGSRLLEFIGARASQKAFDWLISKNVEVLLNQSIDLSTGSDGYYQTSKGQIIQADCYFVCTGLAMGTSWLSDTILRDKMDLRGRLMVDDKLRVRGYKNIFAVGDVTDIPEIKQGYLAQRHALVTSKNIKLLMTGREDKMVSYSPGLPIAFVSFGRKEAVAQFPFLTILGRIPGMLKSGDLFVGKTRKQLGLNPYLEPTKEQKIEDEELMPLVTNHED